MSKHPQPAGLHVVVQPGTGDHNIREGGSVLYLEMAQEF